MSIKPRNSTFNDGGVPNENGYVVERGAAGAGAGGIGAPDTAIPAVLSREPRNTRNMGTGLRPSGLGGAAATEPRRSRGPVFGEATRTQLTRRESGRDGTSGSGVGV